MKYVSLASGLFLSLSMGTVSAAPKPTPTPSYCDAGVGDPDPTTNTSTPALSTLDMMYNSKPATNCYGYVASDNDTASDMNALNWGTGWQFAARDNIGGADVSNTVLGISWTLTSTTGSQGTWLLTGTDMNGGAPNNLGDTFDFVGILKGGNGWAAYLFENVVFDGSDGGTWSIEFTNNGGQIPNLSHLSVYTRSGEVPLELISEPSALALAGLGILGIVLTRRKQYAS